MQHFPVFLAIAGRRVVVSGGGHAAASKLRLLFKTEAHLSVYAEHPLPEIEAWASEGLLTLHRRRMDKGDTVCAVLFYGANEDAEEDAALAAIARADGALVNIVDNLEDSAFITPAMVDRDPVVVAIGTEGAAPVLARAIKSNLEAQLPATLGRLARIAKAFRKSAETLPLGRIRRNFWQEFFFTEGPRAISQGETEAQNALNELLGRHRNGTQRPGHVSFVGAGPGDPELLTLRARRALDAADVVIHDRLVTPNILELARREALIISVGKEGFGPSMAQDDINALIVEHAKSGAQVVRLKGGDATLFGRLDDEMDACDAAGIQFSIVPGITSASAAVASLGQSLTRRGRNASVRFLTGHDVKGFADHDWTALARPGEVAAIYMGKKAARFLQGRLLLHGADRTTPVTVVENASRPDQRILATTLDRLPSDLAEAEMAGPALTLLGLAPRAAAQAASDLMVSQRTREFA